MSSQLRYLTIKEVEILQLQEKLRNIRESLMCVVKLQRPRENDIRLRDFLTSHVAYLKEQQEVLEEKLRLPLQLQEKIRRIKGSVMVLEQHLPLLDDIPPRRFLTCYVTYLKDQQKVLEGRLNNCCLRLGCIHETN